MTPMKLRNAIRDELFSLEIGDTFKISGIKKKLEEKGIETNSMDIAGIVRHKDRYFTMIKYDKKNGPIYKLINIPKLYLDKKKQMDESDTDD